MKKEENITIHCNNIEEWHNWLKENHLKETSVAVKINKKHTGKGTISHLESMKEAIKFGWIDTTIKKVDEDHYIRNFRRRTDKSTWSDNTLSYAKDLHKNNHLFPEGLKRYEEGLKKPTLDYGIPKNPNAPKELIKALKENKEAERNFNKLAPSHKRTYLRWIIKAKLPETRQKRIQSTISKLSRNEKPNILKNE